MVSLCCSEVKLCLLRLSLDALKHRTEEPAHPDHTHTHGQRQFLGRSCDQHMLHKAMVM